MKSQQSNAVNGRVPQSATSNLRQTDPEPVDTARAIKAHPDHLSGLIDSLTNASKSKAVRDEADDEAADAAEEIAEQINFKNYKGIYDVDFDVEQYTCPETGAHFEPKDLCRRI